MKRTPHILMILDGSYPADIRVRKEAETLARHFEVSVLCHSEQERPREESLNGVKILRHISSGTVAQRAWYDIVNSIRFEHPLFAPAIAKCIQNHTPAVLHVHDLPLAGTALKIARNHGIKTVIDLHENYPEALSVWFRWRKNPLVRIKNKLLFGYRRWKKYEAKMIKHFDGIICVIDEMKNFLESQYPGISSKTVIVENTESTAFSRLISQSTLPAFWQKHTDKYLISYTGGIGPHRGLQTAIRAMPAILEHIPSALLLIIGPGHPDSIEYLKKLARNHRVEEAVLFTGPVGFSHIPAIMHASQINIIPHEENQHTEHTVPHKLYQIMMSKSPLLVSSVAPLKRIVETYNAGWIFQAGNPGDFARKAIAIHRNNDEVQKRVLNAWNACIHQGLNWEKSSTKLTGFYTHFLP